MSNGLFRLRVRYGKQGRLAYLSHLELIRALERAIRRADLPYSITQGFHPHMKIAFGPALPVGCGGTGEFLDVWLTRFIEPEEVLESLRVASPEDLAPTEANYVHASEKSLTAVLTLGTYEALCVPDTESMITPEELAVELIPLFEERLATGEVFVPGKKKDRTFDLKKVLWESPQVEAVPEGARVRFGIRTSNEGSLRPDAYLSAANGLFAEAKGTRFAVRELTRTGLFTEE